MKKSSDLLKSAVRKAIPRPVRNWLRSPTKSSEWLWDSAKFSLGVTQAFDIAPGRTLLCHPHAYKVAVRAQLDDALQKQEFQNFLSYCGPSMFLFDIGAHFGIFSLASALFGGTAIAIDASPIATRMVDRQIRLNNCANRVRVLQKTVSDASGAIDMLSSGVFSDGYFRVASGRAANDLTKTEAITVDDLVSAFGSPTHLKIDVEGHEAAVLRGAHHTLLSASPIIFLELHNAMIRAEAGDPAAVLQELRSAGYRLFELNGAAANPEAVLTRDLTRLTARAAQ